MRRWMLFWVVGTVLLAAGMDGWCRKHRTYVIQKGDTPMQVAGKFEITIEALLKFNEISEAEFKAGEQLLIPFPGEVAGNQYTVKAGDSVARVADFHGVSQKDLRVANGMRKNEQLRVGQKIVIPEALRGGAIRGHVVRKRDTLASIAQKYKVSVKALAHANKMSEDSELERGRRLIIPYDDDAKVARYHPSKIDRMVKSGKKVKNGVVHTVQPGQSLWLIARAYNRSGEKIARATGFDPAVALRPGQKILIPDVDEVVAVRAKGSVVEPVHFVSVWNDESAVLQLIQDNGKIDEKSRRALSELAGPKSGTGKLRLFHPRLIQLLQRVAERFPGKKIEIVSGYRPRAPGEKLSKHHQGRAIDFRVAGVSKKELYQFIKTFPNVGAGYYPNSVFVHLDVRDKRTLWTDRSGIEARFDDERE